MCPLVPGGRAICLSDGFGKGPWDCMCISPFSPTWEGCLASSKLGAGGPGEGVLATGSLAGGCIHTAGGTFEGLHAAVPLDVQMLQPPAFPALPKLHLDLRGLGGEGRRNKPSGKLAATLSH